MLNNFSIRSGKSELLDGTNIERSLIIKNLHELDILNRTTGAHNLSIKALKNLLTDHQKTYHIVDLGCGSGDALMAMAAWARKKNYKVKLTGVDKSQDAVKYLRFHCRKFEEISGVTDDYRNYISSEKEIDIVHCSLFCHHLNQKELFDLFSCFRTKLKTGFIINDLHRTPMAYYSAWLFTRLLNGSALSRNDGPLSVLKGFKKEELIDLLDKSGIRKYSISKAFPFRFLITAKTAYDG